MGEHESISSTIRGSMDFSEFDEAPGGWSLISKDGLYPQIYSKGKIVVTLIPVHVSPEKEDDVFVVSVTGNKVLAPADRMLRFEIAAFMRNLI